MRKLYENFHILNFQKRIVSVETIRGNTISRFDVSPKLASLIRILLNSDFLRKISTFALENIFDSSLRHYF